MTSPGKVKQCLSTPDAAEHVLQNATAPVVQMLQNAPSPSVTSAPECTELLQNAPKCTTLSTPLENDKTNPTPPPKPLTHRQLAAVRLIVQGVSTPAITRHLEISRHSLIRWKRLPAFAAAVRAMTDRATQFAVTAGARSQRPPAPPRRLLTPEEVAARDPAFAAALRRPPAMPPDPEFDALMADLKKLSLARRGHDPRQP